MEQSYWQGVVQLHDSSAVSCWMYKIVNLASTVSSSDLFMQNNFY